MQPAGAAVTSADADTLIMACRTELHRHHPESKNAEALRNRLASLVEIRARLLRREKQIEDLRKLN